MGAEHSKNDSDVFQRLLGPMLITNIESFTLPMVAFGLSGRLFARDTLEYLVRNEKSVRTECINHGRRSETTVSETFENSV